MKYLKYILLIVIVLIAVFAIVFSCCFSKLENAFSDDKAETISVKIGRDSNTFYLRAKMWGIAGNHEQIVLSKSKDNIPDGKTDYIFYTSEIFYKVNNGTIFVYAPESSISEPIEKNPNVVIKELKSYDEIKKYNADYLNYGLERFGFYK